jgi:hypothetical protein
LFGLQSQHPNDSELMSAKKQTITNNELKISENLFINGFLANLK